MFLRTVATIFDVLTLIGCLVGGYQVFTSITPDASAIQTSAGVAIGIALAAIPYCLAGAFHRGAVREMMVKQLPRD